MTKTKRGVGDYGTAAFQDVGDAVGRYVEVACKFGGRDSEFMQFVFQNSPG